MKNYYVYIYTIYIYTIYIYYIYIYTIYISSGFESRTFAKGPGFKSWRVSYFLFVPLRSFFLCYPGEVLEGPISTGVSNKLNNIDSNNGILISQKYYTTYSYI